jgi:hypothetical protein
VEIKTLQAELNAGLASVPRITTEISQYGQDLPPQLWGSKSLHTPPLYLFLIWGREFIAVDISIYQLIKNY